MSHSGRHHLSKSPQKSNVWSVPQDKLKIIIRIRPVLNEQQQTEFVELQDHNTLQIKRPGNFTFMKFNNILTNYSTQKDVFNLLEQSVNQFLQGTNITIFAYGQTGAGKTYSTIGNYSSEDQQNIYHLLSSEQRGILSRSLEMIMEAIQNQEDTKITISFYEIYNEKIYDLYNKEGSGALEIRESKSGEISIPNLTIIQINRIQEAIHYLMIGLRNRSTGSTHANAKSSRSHSIFQISMQKDNQTSSLRIVDLAGSEKFKIPSDITPAQKQIRIQELTSINGSLSCLGHCISALIEKSRTHIPFRNSKLTRILSDSLLGLGKMRFIICISPSVSASAQTFSTLQFANRAKRAIFERAQIRTPQMSKKKSQIQQAIHLRKEIQKQRELRLSYEQELSQTKRQNVFLKIENEKLIVKLKQLNTKVNEMSKTKSTTLIHQTIGDETDKQNDLHDQMLSLPIFQKNRGQNGNGSSNVSGVKPINLKKAEFQKKIRKFIQQSSPEGRQYPSQITIPLKQSVSQNQQNNSKLTPVSNNQKQLQKILFLLPQSNQQKVSNLQIETKSNNFVKPGSYENGEDIDDSLWQYHQQQTQEFLQKACSKMNMKEYEDLKQEMQKAKSELMRFKLKDNEIERKGKIGNGVR